MRLRFYLLSSLNDSIPTFVVNIVRSDVAKRLVVAMPVVVIDKFEQGSLKIAWSLPAKELDLVLERAVVTSDLAVGLWGVRLGKDMSDAFILKVVGKIF